MSTSGGSSAGELLVAHAVLNEAALEALFTAPTTVIPAPGAGRAIIPLEAAAELATQNTSSIVNPPVDTTFYWTTATVPTQALQTSNPEILQDTAPQINGLVVYPPFTLSGLGPNYDRALVANQPLIYAARTAGARGGYDGPILTSSLAAGGTGYVAGDTGTVATDVHGPAAAYVVNTVAAITGAVLTYTITDPGDGYSTIDNPLATATGGAQPGVGTGFTINVLTVVPANATAYLTVWYHVVNLH